MNAHEILHWLDDLRGSLGDATFSWNVVRGNIGAWPYQTAIAGVVTTVVYPPLRDRAEAFLKRHIEAGNAELHEKLNHLIRHSPDIPDYKPGSSQGYDSDRTEESP
jgi:hypothetical protein